MQHEHIVGTVTSCIENRAIKQKAAGRAEWHCHLAEVIPGIYTLQGHEARHVEKGVERRGCVVLTSGLSCWQLGRWHPQQDRERRNDVCVCPTSWW